MPFGVGLNVGTTVAADSAVATASKLVSMANIKDCHCNRRMPDERGRAHIYANFSLPSGQGSQANYARE